MEPHIPHNKQIATELEQRMRDYYKSYYQKQLGLVDWETRVEHRLNEETILGIPSLNRLQDWMGLDFKSQKVLVVGAGTGAETVEFHRRGAEVHAIEPSEDACAILNLKFELEKIPKGRIRQAVAEELPYKDGAFDFVYCYTVLEHVQDVEKSIDEMIRVCKVGGVINIQTPDYRFPYEGHYKSNRIPFSPRWLTYLLFALQGKPVAFLRTVNFVTAPQLDRIFLRRNVITIRATPPNIRTWEQGRANPLQMWFIKTFAINKDQFIFLKKIGES